jgi:hypothetical protein
MVYRILAFISMSLVCAFWFALKPLLISALMSATVGAGLLGDFFIQFLFLILDIILFIEIIMRFSFVTAIQAFKPIQTTVESWPEIDPEQLLAQTKVLETLGFTVMTDYTIPRFKGLIRLMLNPEQQCYAEVFQVGKSPMTLIFGSPLEQNYLIAANSQSQDRPLLTGYWYAFFRIQKHFYKRFADMPATAIFTEFLSLRQELTSRLKLEILPVTNAADHFQMIQNIRKLQRRGLLKKSIIFSILDMLIFAANPKYEYLGEDLKVPSS